MRARTRGPAVAGPEPVAGAASHGVARVIEDLFGADLPVTVQAYDGSRAGPADAPARVVIRSKDAVRRLVTSPNELGISRAYVAGDVDVEGDIYEALQLAKRVDVQSLGPAQWRALLRLTGPSGLRPLPAPPEEARLRGRLHNRARDAAAISHHYDVSNEFYRLLLGPAMTYSCAVWDSPDRTLEEAQAAKHDLVCRKLGLRPGMRLLDVGCGWGGMLLHAAREYGVTAVGVTISQRQAEWARDAVAKAGLGGRVEVRLQDYRDVGDGPYDAISSIGMFEHVGLEQLGAYFTHLYELLRPGGRLLNHGIATRDEPDGRPRPTFINRYVFPDGALHEVGAVVSAIHRKRFEVRHVENLREHYALTLRAWSANLEQHWEEAVAQVGLTRARIWRLYIAASALAFDSGRVQIHQTLAVRPDHQPLDARSGMPLRPDWGA